MTYSRCFRARPRVSVLFNEPKLLKKALARDGLIAEASFSALQRAEIAENLNSSRYSSTVTTRFSALQRAEIAENQRSAAVYAAVPAFQCSSTSRNC